MVHTTAALDREWERDYAHSSLGQEALARWAATEPELDGLFDLDCVLLARRQEGRSDAILSALGRLASSDPVAARTLYQAMLPGLVKMALRRFGDHRGAVEEITAIAWVRIASYPPDRPGPVAGNVMLDVSKRYLQARAIAAPKEEVLSDRVALDGNASSAEDAVMESSIVLDLERAFRRGVITDRALDIIVQTRLHDVSLDEVGAAHGTTGDYAQCVRWRAEKVLRRRLRHAA